MSAQIPKQKSTEASLGLPSADLADAGIEHKARCGYRPDCGGFRCARQPQARDAGFDDLIESGAAQIIADYPECARDAHAAALALSFDPEDLVGLDPSATAHALATRKDVDPNCRVVLEILERIKGEFWSPWAGNNLERLRRKSADEGQPLRKRKRKKAEDGLLRPSLFREFGVELPSSPMPSTAKSSKRTKHVQSQSVVEVEVDPTLTVGGADGHPPRHDGLVKRD